ncbi:uncharacterized protein [Musca autumnalis]|uniref:uncharacterized protein n=1 Tax=Musca autumnalis TaxID=221902 RepID=UPI003CF9BA4D
MNFTKTEGSFNKKYMKNMTIWLEKGLLNLDLDTERNLEYGLRSSIAIQIKMPNSQSFQRLFSYEFDVCQLLNEISKESIINMWYRVLLKNGNFMENCPIVKGHYYIRNLRLDANTIPVFLRSGEYQITSLSYYGKRKTKSYDQVARVFIGIKIY